MCFKVLPWQPRPVFTGVSEYTLDSEGYIIRQQDYWDSINLEKGKYSAKGKLTGLSDFAAQLKKVSNCNCFNNNTEVA
jgi:predicted metal-binding transcription factor (methanogenesis marker protein 9)